MRYCDPLLENYSDIKTWQRLFLTNICERRLREKGPYHAKFEIEIWALEASVLKTRTVSVNRLYCGNRLTSFSSTFMANVGMGGA